MLEGLLGEEACALNETGYHSCEITVKMQRNVSVFVNSSDGFEDCWSPFFTLFAKYWPQYKGPLYLNTEQKTWSHPDLNIQCTTVQPELCESLTWSECLKWGLSKIQTPLVLYMQEDYFLHQPVQHERLMAAVGHMILHPEVRHIGLTRHGSAGPFADYPAPDLQIIGRNARYRISTQAGLWRVETLLSYIEAVENGWMFEIYGTWRSHRRRECFLTAKFDRASRGPPIDYLHTGIIKGRWLWEIQEIFRANNIQVDYTRRGFYRPKHTLARKIETASRLLANPLYFATQLLRSKIS